MAAVAEGPRFVQGTGTAGALAFGGDGEAGHLHQGVAHHLACAEDLSGGDFVRTTKQLIDLLRQLSLVAPERSTRSAAAEASERLFRGVVAASSVVADTAGGGTPS